MRPGRPADGAVRPAECWLRVAAEIIAKAPRRERTMRAAVRAGSEGPQFQTAGGLRAAPLRAVDRQFQESGEVLPAWLPGGPPGRSDGTRAGRSSCFQRLRAVLCGRATHALWRGQCGESRAME